MALTDRRVGKTIADIHNALIAELKKSSPEDISVSNLCRIADIGRGTFYTHYDGIYDVLQEIEDDFMQNIRDFCFAYFEVTDSSETRSQFEVLLEYIRRNSDLFDIFLYQPGTNFAFRIEKQIYELFYYHNLKYRPQLDEKSVRYGVNAGLCAALGIIREWYAGGMTDDIKTVAGLLSDNTGYIAAKSGMKGK